MTTPSAAIRIPRPEALLAHQQRALDETIAFRRAFKKTSGSTDPTAAVTIPSPEEMLAKQQEMEKIAARRRTFIETSGQRVADRIIVELVNQVRETDYKEWVFDTLFCKKINIGAMCDYEYVLADQIIHELVAPAMRAAGWRVYMSSLYVCIRAGDRDDDNEEDKEKDNM